MISFSKKNKSGISSFGYVYNKNFHSQNSIVYSNPNNYKLYDLY